MLYVGQFFFKNLTKDEILAKNDLVHLHFLHAHVHNL